MGGVHTHLQTPRVELLGQKPPMDPILSGALTCRAQENPLQNVRLLSIWDDLALSLPQPSHLNPLHLLPLMSS